MQTGAARTLSYVTSVACLLSPIHSCPSISSGSRHRRSACLALSWPSFRRRLAMGLASHFPSHAATDSTNGTWPLAR
eukprot:3590224-Pleurochrysis_carterae.AAC.1